MPEEEIVLNGRDDESGRAIWVLNQSIAELRQTGLVASAALLVAGAVLASTSALTEWRAALLISMILAAFAALHSHVAGWRLIMEVAKVFYTEDQRKRLDGDHSQGGRVNAWIALFAFPASALALIVFLIKNIL